jgi:hypothetical protein
LTRSLCFAISPATCPSARSAILVWLIASEHFYNITQRYGKFSLIFRSEFTSRPENLTFKKHENLFSRASPPSTTA